MWETNIPWYLGVDSGWWGKQFCSFFVGQMISWRIQRTWTWKVEKYATTMVDADMFGYCPGLWSFCQKQMIGSSPLRAPLRSKRALSSWVLWRTERFILANDYKSQPQSAGKLLLNWPSNLRIQVGCNRVIEVSSRTDETLLYVLWTRWIWLVFYYLIVLSRFRPLQSRYYVRLFRQIRCSCWSDWTLRRRTTASNLCGWITSGQRIEKSEASEGWKKYQTWWKPTSEGQTSLMNRVFETY